MSARAVGKPQRAPETLHEVQEWQRRRGDYLRSGVGAASCETGTCHVQGAYATGGGYGPPAHPACAACAAVMATWGTRRAADTNYYRVPRGGVVPSADWQTDTARVVVPLPRAATSGALAEPLLSSGTGLSTESVASSAAAAPAVTSVSANVPEAGQ